VAGREVDVVHAEHLKSMPMVEHIAGKVPTVFDAVDCISVFEARRRRLLQNPFLRSFSRMEWGRMTRGEAKASGLFNRIVISSTVDKESYPAPSHLRHKVDMVPNGIDLEHFEFHKYQPETNLIVFCAKLDYFPNQDAAVYFVQSVWPVLLARRPQLRLEIVGSRPPRSVRRLDGKNNIQVIPSVPDVRPHLGRAWVAISPIRAQAGTQNKVLEAMALGVPVVATQMCCSGLAVEAGKHLLVADTPEEFASAVEYLLDDQLLRANIVRAARAYVERHHDCAECVKGLCQVYEEAVSDFARQVESVERH
jgi:hypothetical protein